jgi:hypothetical protein
VELGTAELFTVPGDWVPTAVLVPGVPEFPTPEPLMVPAPLPVPMRLLPELLSVEPGDAMLPVGWDDVVVVVPRLS